MGKLKTWFTAKQLEERRKHPGMAPPSRCCRRKLVAAYKRMCREELCCLPSRKQIRERIKAKEMEPTWMRKARQYAERVDKGRR